MDLGEISKGSVSGASGIAPPAEPELLYALTNDEILTAISRVQALTPSQRDRQNSESDEVVGDAVNHSQGHLFEAEDHGCSAVNEGGEGPEKGASESLGWRRLRPIFDEEALNDLR